jgi:DNA-binding MarR family transcriptional regulator
MLAGRQHSNAIVMFHTAVAARLGLNATDEKILDLLDREASVTAGGLVQQTGLAPSSITAALDRLERKGFVRRHRDPVDQRRVTVELRQERIAEGAALFTGLMRGLDELYAGYTDDELATILDFMRRSADMQREATLDVSEASDG